MYNTLSVNMLRTLSRGKNKLSDEALNRIQAFIRSQQLEDSSFMDKNGCADVYYTAFGWLLCYVFGLPIPRTTASNYLNSLDSETLDLVHYAAYTRCKRLLFLMGFHPFKMDTILGKKNSMSSKKDSISLKRMASLDDSEGPYALFVRLSLLEDAGKRLRNPEEWLQTLRAYRTPSGGYSNLKSTTGGVYSAPNTSHAGTETTSNIIPTVNATAAALCVLKQLKSPEASTTADFLLSCQHASGGFAASPDAPLPDLLSTATALFALHANGRKPNPAAREFVEAHWSEQSGGFSATLFDDTSDIEYTFYGLLALGTL